MKKIALCSVIAIMTVSGAAYADRTREYDLNPRIFFYEQCEEIDSNYNELLDLITRPTETDPWNRYRECVNNAKKLERVTKLFNDICSKNLGWPTITPVGPNDLCDEPDPDGECFARGGVAVDPVDENTTRNSKYCHD